MTKFLKCRLGKTVVLSQMISLAVLTGFSFSAQAEVQSGYEHYVTDNIDIPFRSQPGYKYRILRMVKTGDKVEVLEVNDEKWARVAYVDGKGKKWEGWMPSILLQNEPVARIQLKNQQEKFIDLEKRFNQQVLEKETLQKRYDETSTELQSIQKAHFQLKKQYEQLKEISSNSVALSEENTTLKANIQKLNSENMIIKEQLNEAEDVVQRQWFLTGAGVLFLGLMLGRFARLPEKRKRWDSL